MDSRGFMRLIDRKKDMILVSGFNVYPNEIEDVIAMHPDVREVRSEDTRLNSSHNQRSRMPSSA